MQSPSHDLSNVAAGPGASPDIGIAPLPLLEGATDYEFVELHNPLQVPFTGIVGITRPVNVPFEIRTDGMTTASSRTEQDVMRTYGTGSLKNPEYPAKGHIQQRVTIPSGKTIRLPGSQAQVIVRQLVNEIMSRNGDKLLMADAFARSQVEAQVVLRRSSMQEIMDAPVDVQTQMHNALDKVNEAQNEEPFAGLGQTDTGKAEPAAKPAPDNSNPPTTPPTSPRKPA